MVDCLTGKNTAETIEHAKKLIAKWYNSDVRDRKWLEAHVDCYGDKTNRVQIFVFEGSPSKGIVLVEYGMGTYVVAINPRRNKKKIYSVGNTTTEEDFTQISQNLKKQNELYDKEQEYILKHSKTKKKSSFGGFIIKSGEVKQLKKEFRNR